MTELQWPALPSGERPRWDGERFWLGASPMPFIGYSENLDGWNDSLTSLHKRESAGLHPIDITSRSNALAALDRLVPGGPAAILEIGSSDGYLLRDLRATYPDAAIVGSEVAPDALRQIATEQPGIPLVQFDILDCPLPAASFDAVVALNVLEHIEDDSSALAGMARLLRPDGIAIIEVPAGPRLFDAYDRQLHHFRRYTMADLVRKVEGAGLRIEQQTHIGFFVFAGFAAVKSMNRLREHRLAGADVVGSSIRQTKSSRLLDVVFKLERMTFGKVRWPLGIRCFVAARKAAR